MYNINFRYETAMYSLDILTDHSLMYLKCSKSTLFYKDTIERYINELQQKIDEAIKYIKNDNNFIDYKDYNGKEENDLLELLKILKGEKYE